MPFEIAGVGVIAVVGLVMMRSGYWMRRRCGGIGCEDGCLGDRGLLVALRRDGRALVNAVTR